MSYLARSKAALARLRAAAPPDPEELARLLSLPLDLFAQEGRPLEVRVPWWPVTLFFVPDLRHAAALEGEGIERARIWTPGELLMLLGASPDLASLRMIALARREFDGEVVEVRPCGYAARPSEERPGP